MEPAADVERGDGVGTAPEAVVRGEKRAGAYRTITEVAEDLGIPQHVLRFWETRFAQVRPVKRAGGRRYYRPDDIEILKGVRSLLHGQGYTIKGVQLIFRERGARFVQAVGRGEAEAGAPPRGRNNPGDPGSAPDGDCAALRAVLDDLRACRDLLADLLDPA